MNEDPQHTLIPLDEARVAYAELLVDLIEDAYEAFPTQGTSEVATALAIATRAMHLLRAAVVLQRERGTSWADIAHGTGRDEARVREDFEDAVRTWTQQGRRRHRGDADTLMVAGLIDGWYRQSADPDVPRVMTDLLDPADHDARDRANHDRAQSEALRAANAELSRPDDVSQTAAVMDVLADRLAGHEPPLTDEHRWAAQEIRTGLTRIVTEP
ncbi:hypothetical protein ACFRCG_07115 [Embleya sp. NPDC056575]|uniref:hypothetical protein n=1 Tax=unclassified Embleya TaxID=2699296 RepID=UPI00369FC8B3